MEKFIINHVIKIDFEYYHTFILPIIYSSKEQFLIDFEEILKTKFDEYNLINSEIRNKTDERSKTITKYKLSSNDLHIKKIKDLHHLIGELSIHLEKSSTFDLGGQSFNVHDFIEYGEKGKYSFNSINIQTIDEFFKPVLETTKKLNL